MTARDQPEEVAAATVLDTPPISSPAPKEPYSIFDKRQKALIVLIVSTAATCEPKPNKVILYLIS